MSYLFKFIMFVIPVIFVLMCMKAVSTGTFAIPDVEGTISMFSALHIDDITEAMRMYEQYHQITINIDINSWDTFWSAIGNFFQSALYFISFIVQILFVPLNLLGWVFGFVA